MALISLRTVAPARDIVSIAGSWLHPPQPIAPPTPAYDEQAFDSLYALIPAYHSETPAIDLKLGVVEDATVVVTSGYDGIILDRNGAAVKETTYYSEIYPKNIDTLDFEVNGPVTELDDIFVAFDGAWWVYYHWLFSCLGSAGIAQKVLPGSAAIAVPDWARCGPKRPSVISKRVFHQVRRVVEPGRLIGLGDGAFRARRAYFLFVDGGQPSDAALHPLYRDVFNSLRPQRLRPPQPGIFVSRGGRGRSERVTAADEKIFNGVMLDYNLKKVLLEDLSLGAQIDLFSSARLIVAPHGSGLANLVFAGSNAKVVELHTEFEAPKVLLPWFYLLAAASGLRYAFLNREAGDFSAGRLRDAVRALGVPEPKLNPILRIWRATRQMCGAALVRIGKISAKVLTSRLRRIAIGDEKTSL